MKKRWSLQEDVDRGIIGLLSLQLGVKPLLSRILYLRGIKTWEQAKDFFRPEISQLHDPFLMNGMDVAIKRIEAAIQQNEKMLEYHKDEKLYCLSHLVERSMKNNKHS